MYDKKIIFGFGTRPVTDVIGRQFVSHLDHSVWFDGRKYVGQLEKTMWPGFRQDAWINQRNPIVVTGILRGTEELIKLAEQNKINYYYFDHAYFFRADEHRNNPLTNNRSYRLCVNSQHLNYISELDNHTKHRKEVVKNLLSKYRLKPEPWHLGTKGYILLIPPSQFVCNFYNLISPNVWIRQMRKKLFNVTDRPIVIRTKGESISLSQQLKEAYCVVSFQSTVAIEAVLSGTPSFCDPISSAAPVSKTNIDEINSPYYPDDFKRRQWRDSLLYNQFTMDEIKMGIAKDTVDRLQKRNWINDNNA